MFMQSRSARMFQLLSIGFPPSRANEKKKNMINLGLHCDDQCLDGFKFSDCSADTLYDPRRRTFGARFSFVLHTASEI